MKAPTFTILAEGVFGVVTAKTAASAVRYLPDRVLSVVDTRFAGQTVIDALGFGGDIPIFATLSEVLELEPKPEALLVGIAQQGGALPEEWRGMVHAALHAGLDVWSGLHTFLSEDPDLASHAAEHGCQLVDLRKPPDDLVVATGKAQQTAALRVLTIGSDCNSGKMTTAIELKRGLEKVGLQAGFGATGQTGILLEGSGIAVDAVVADFIAGAAERLTLEADNGADVILVEGQGSLMHPGYSGVTLGLLHGAIPQAMILTLALCATAAAHAGGSAERAGGREVGEWPQREEKEGRFYHGRLRRRRRDPVRQESSKGSRPRQSDRRAHGL